jgi:tetratricopeptide (TPR) repeat protein
MRLPVATAIVVVASLLAGGCDEFNARRKINEGNKLYKEGKFEAAIAEFESSLREKEIDVAHYNLGLTYAKLFNPGEETPENEKIADKSAEHLEKWLASHPKDNDIRKMMTKVWVDAGRFEKALAYWQKEHEADKTNRDVMAQMANINALAGRHEEAVKWILMDADVAPTEKGKFEAYVRVGNLTWRKLSNREKVRYEERIRVADIGIAALQKAIAIDPKEPNPQGLLAAIYNFRSIGHGSSFALNIDRTTSQNHDQKRRVLAEEKKKSQPPKPPAEAPAGKGSATPGG